MPKIIINTKYCKGCEICTWICPKNVFEMSRELSERGYHNPIPIRLNDCILCRQCELYCPDQAIVIIEDEEK